MLSLRPAENTVELYEEHMTIMEERMETERGEAEDRLAEDMESGELAGNLHPWTAKKDAVGEASYDTVTHLASGFIEFIPLM